MKASTPLYALLASLLLVAACDRMAPEAPTPAVPEDAVAVVNGKPITQGQLTVYQNRRGGQGATEDHVNDLISIELLAQAAEADGTAAQETLLAELASHRSATLAQAVVRARLESNPITDEQVTAEYARFLAEDLGEELHARHILVDDEVLARALIVQLDEGADFSELAREHSKDGSAESGGDLGWFDEGTMVAPFVATAAALEVGQYTAEPMQSRFGWHVIMLDGRRATEAPPLDEIRQEIVGFLQAQMIEAWVNELRAQASIEIR